MTEPMKSQRTMEEIARGIAEFHLNTDCSCEHSMSCKTCNLSNDIKEVLDAERQQADRKLHNQQVDHEVMYNECVADCRKAEAHAEEARKEVQRIQKWADELKIGERINYRKRYEELVENQEGFDVQENTRLLLNIANLEAHNLASKLHNERLVEALEKIAKPALGGKQQQWIAQEALTSSPSESLGVVEELIKAFHLFRARTFAQLGHYFSGERIDNEAMEIAKKESDEAIELARLHFPGREV